MEAMRRRTRAVRLGPKVESDTDLEAAEAALWIPSEVAFSVTN